MRMTYSTARERAETATANRQQAGGGRNVELLGLVAASLLCLVGVWLVSSARAPMLAETQTLVASGHAVDLNTVERVEQLLTVLEPVVADPSERRFVADRLMGWLTTPDGTGAPRRRVDSIGSVSTIQVADADVRSNRRLTSFRDRLAERREQLVSTGVATEARVPLLTATQLTAFRRVALVRSPGDFRRALIISTALLLAGFYVAHAWIRFRRSAADTLLLPIIHVLCAIGFVMMLSLRDPARDALLFMRFAQGTFAGAIVLAVAASIDFQQSMLRRLSYVPLAGAVALSLLLIAFGSGPGTSDAKVNLLGVQPVEAIRVLVVLFLAGYFSNRWELLRSLKEPRAGSARSGFDVPRFDYVLPVIIGMALVLLFFFLQKDLGPALVLACVFLALYGVARGRILMVAIGVALLVTGFAAGYAIGYPHTVVQRVQIWMSPWDNPVRGGDQIAHALWALATGGGTGTGLGLGDPRFVPAGHTDLILAVVGEELGFIGLIVVFGLCAALAYRAVRISLRAPGDYTFFLGLGLMLGIFVQLLLIAGGLLALVPLTGVTTPFLSYGRSSMLANFFAFGVLMSISARRSTTDRSVDFGRPVWWVVGTLAVLVLAVSLRAGYIQVIAGDRHVSGTALTLQADGMRRFAYNPRLLVAAQQIARGAITDRNGIPLATSQVSDLQAHARQLAELGVSATDVCAPTSTRCYPFGGLTYHLLGDWRTQANWAAPNTSFVERDSDARLRGYDDHARIIDVTDPKTGRVTKVIRRDLIELVPLLRHRYDPQDPSVVKLLTRPRTVTLALDIRLQLKVAAALKSGVEHAGQKEGAAVVLSQDGDLVASVSYPWPTMPARLQVRSTNDTTTVDPTPELMDRARYAVYPPGSSFKLVTAAAAIRKAPSLPNESFVCERLPDGRVGRHLPGWARPIRDDEADRVPHGRLAMEQALVVSCNAYFAQLGLRLGAPALQETAALFEISLSQPESDKRVRDTLPFAAYGQGQVLATPFKMARVAATIGGDGSMPQGRWVIDDTNRRTDAPRPILEPAQARSLASTMRRVVLEGTGRSLKDVEPPVAGKTGTAEVQDQASHAWFVGFAPYRAAAAQPAAAGSGQATGTNAIDRIAFAVIVEHGGYGGAAAAPIAGQIVTSARTLGIIR